jgi:uncharacterized protein (TIGR03000 family)
MNKRCIFALMTSVLAIALIATPAYAQRGGGGRGWGGGGGRGWGGGGWEGGRGWGGGGYGGGFYNNGFYGGRYGGIGLGGIGLGWDGYYGNGYEFPANYYYEGAQPFGPVVGGMSNYQVQNPNGPVINGPTLAMQSFYSGPSTSTGKAELTVKVPANAQVWLGTMQSGQTGAERHFSFPSLSGSNMFTVRANWMDNGQPVTRDKQVDMKPGGNVSVDFTQPGNDKPATNPSKDGNPAPGSAFEIKKDTPPLPSPGVPPKK